MIQGENKSKINKGFQNTLLLDFITLENYVEKYSAFEASNIFIHIKKN